MNLLKLCPLSRTITSPEFFLFDTVELFSETTIIDQIMTIISVRKLEGFPSSEVSLDLTFVGSFHEIIAFFVFREEF